MKDKLLCALLGLGLLLGLTGCSLAQPEREAKEGQGDRFCGVYVSYKEPGDPDFYNNPNLTEYGTDTVELGELGTHAFPREVLFAGEDGRFPGLEGSALYVLETEEEWGSCSTAVGEMSGGAFNVKDTDEGTEYDISGVLYFGPPENAPADWSTNDIPGVWHAYKVYQAPDGRAYLDGSGDSFRGGPIGFSLCEEQAYTADGKTKKDSLSVKVEVEQIPRLTALSISQYGADGTLLGNAAVPLVDEPPSVKWLPDSAFAVISETGAEGTTHTLYDRPGEGEEQTAHSFVLLDSRGVGREVRVVLE